MTIRAGLILGVLAALIPNGHADEPTFNDRRLSEWVAMLQKDLTPRKRRAAVVALGQLASTSTDARVTALTAIGKALRTDANAPVREQAALVLGQQKPDDSAFVVPDLVTSMREEKTPSIRRAVANTLARFGPQAAAAVRPLSDALADPDDGVKAAAADALGRVGADAAPAAESLVKLATDGPKSVRQSALFALGRIEPADKPAATIPLIAAAGGTDTDLRQEALISLGLLREPTAEVLALLTRGTTDADTEFRLLCVQTIGQFGAAAAATEPAIVAALRTDKATSVRVQAVRAYARLGGENPTDRLVVLVERLKSDPAFEVRVATAEELGRLGPAAKSALASLRTARGDAQAQVREAAATAIQRITNPAKPEKDSGGN